MGIAYNPKVVTDGLVLALDAANVKSYPRSGSSWFDLTQINAAANFSNGITYGTTNNGTLIFNGTNQYGSITHNSILSFGSSGFTCDLFIKTTLTSAASRRLTQKGVGGPNDLEYLFAVNTTGNLTASTSTTGSSQTAASTSTVQVKDNAWTHVALVKSGTSANFYKDGILGFTGTVDASPIQLSGPQYIGGAGAAAYFSGEMASLKIYNRALSDVEVLQNFNATRGRFGI